uniref:Chaperonin Cpn60/TCP-1 n=1 Tax=Syphacia muris TaxID=451379 RepID=A0A0N5B112_9BILA
MNFAILRKQVKYRAVTTGICVSVARSLAASLKMQLCSEKKSRIGIEMGRGTRLLALAE